MCRGTAVISITYRSSALTAITNLAYGNATAFPNVGLVEWVSAEAAADEDLGNKNHSFMRIMIIPTALLQLN